MNRKNTFQKVAWSVAITMSGLGFVGILLDYLIKQMWAIDAPCWGNQTWMDVQYHVSVGLSVFLIILCLLLCVLWLLMGKGVIPMIMVRYVSACIVLLGAQSGLHMLAMNGSIPGIVTELGYLVVMIAPVVFYKNKDRITEENSCVIMNIRRKR